MLLHCKGTIAMPGGSDGKEYARSAGDLGSIPGSGRSSGEREMATHSSILAWRIPWMESLVGYSPWDDKRVRHDLATKQQQQHNTQHILTL